MALFSKLGISSSTWMYPLISGSEIAAENKRIIEYVRKEVCGIKSGNK